MTSLAVLYKHVVSVLSFSTKRSHQGSSRQAETQPGGQHRVTISVLITLMLSAIGDPGGVSRGGTISFLQPPPWLHHPDRNGDATTQVTPWAWPCPTHPEIWHLVPSQQLLEKAVSPQSSSHPSLKMRGRGCMGRKDTHLLPVTWSPALVTEQGALGCTSRSLVSPSRCPRAVPTSPSGALTALELLVCSPTNS